MITMKATYHWASTAATTFNIQSFHSFCLSASLSDLTHHDNVTTTCALFSCCIPSGKESRKNPGYPARCTQLRRNHTAGGHGLHFSKVPTLISHLFHQEMPFWDHKQAKNLKEVIVKHFSTARNVSGSVAKLWCRWFITNLLLKNKNPDFCWDNWSYCVWNFGVGS